MNKKENYKYLTEEEKEILELLISYSYIFGFNQARYDDFKYIPSNDREFKAWQSWLENKDEIVGVMLNGK